MTTESVAHHRRAVNGIKMHYAEAGAGPPVVLLHGFPETWYAWRHQIEALRMRYRLIMPDLRGYGATEKPPTGYDKRTMANDIRALMASLGIERAAIIGHDRGARVGLRLAKDHPDAVARFAALDNIPTRVLFGNMNAASAQAAWFFLFQGVRDLPEVLIHGREELWLRHLLTGWAYNPETFTVIVTVRDKYVCPCCEKTEIKIAAMPLKLIPKSITTPSLLTHITISKFVDHLPLYRQESIYLRAGVEISRGTMARMATSSSVALFGLVVAVG